jgi:diguanylate cyclase (GGDEF)-like protein/PAS domain S-box-containing protein
MHQFFGDKCMSDRISRTVLLINENTQETKSIEQMIRHVGPQDFEVAHVDSLLEATTYLAEKSVDVILLDLESGGVDGKEKLRRVHQAAPRVSIVILSNLAGEPMARQAMRDGAQDYLIKGEMQSRELVRALENAIERKAIDESLFEEKERAQVTLASIGDAVISADPEGRITFLNLMAERMTGWSKPEATGRRMDDVFRIEDATTRETIPNPMNQAIALNRVGHLPTNCILIRRDGHESFIEDSAAPIHDRIGGILGSVIVFRDVSTARALAEETMHASQHDFLTGLPNRLLLNDRLGQAIALAKRRGNDVAVLFMDLDGFKHINDSLGHLVGDRLLQSIAKRLTALIRTPDTISRQGGDEFVVLLQEIETPEDAAVVAKRIIQAVSQVHSIGEHDLFITASIGMSLYPQDGLDGEALMKNADTAMYRAKDSGRQCFKFFKSAMNLRAVERQKMEEELRQALVNEELELYYQPKIDVLTGELVGAEALLRWTHPKRGPVAPVKFIPVAEDSGLILPIGSWVLREACMQAKTWLDQGLPATPMSINVSGVQLQDATFLYEVLAMLEETRLAPELLEMELTESVLLNLPEHAHSALQYLRDLGVTVSIDDFGTGYSSLSALKRLPIDCLKIDQSFLEQVNESPGGAAIAIAIIRMGKSLNLRVVAEGVESRRHLAFLQKYDCDEAQGFFFSQPVPADQFADLLRRRMFYSTPASEQSLHTIRALSSKAS